MLPIMPIRIEWRDAATHLQKYDLTPVSLNKWPVARNCNPLFKVARLWAESQQQTATVLCSGKRQRASGQVDNKGLKCYHITDILLAKLGRNTFHTTPFSLLQRCSSSGSLHKYLTPLHPSWIQTLAASSEIDRTINGDKIWTIRRLWVHSKQRAKSIWNLILINQDAIVDVINVASTSAPLWGSWCPLSCCCWS